MSTELTAEKKQTETYLITGVAGLDPVTVYVTNYKPGIGKLVVECFGDAWSASWAAMGDCNVEQFVAESETDYLLTKLLKQTRQTDFDEITSRAEKRGYEIHAANDAELAMQHDLMAECFGSDWYMDLPTCHTDEYRYLKNIITAIKQAFDADFSTIEQSPAAQPAEGVCEWHNNGIGCYEGCVSVHHVSQVGREIDALPAYCDGCSVCKQNVSNESK